MKTYNLNPGFEIKMKDGETFDILRTTPLKDGVPVKDEIVLAFPDFQIFQLSLKQARKLKNELERLLTKNPQ